MNLTKREAERIFKTHAVFPDSFETCKDLGCPQTLRCSDLT